MEQVTWFEKQTYLNGEHVLPIVPIVQSFIGYGLENFRKYGQVRFGWIAAVKGI